MKKAAALLIIIAFHLNMSAQTSKNYNVLIGTYTSGKSEGIYVYEFNSETREVKYKNKAVGVENPSFLALSPDNKKLYAVNETSEGEVSAFRFDAKSGALTFLNKVPSEGAHPCYISTDKSGKNVFVGNYSGGTLSVLPVKHDGTLGNSIQTIQHEGHGVNKDRQEKAHVHSAVFTPDYNYLLVGDLGIDKAMIYKYDPEKKVSPLSQSIPPFAALKAGSGPRHIAFHPNRKFAYIIQELTAEVTAFTYKDGKLTAIQTVSLLPANFEGKVGAADIHVSPDGNFLYASNRGDANDISIFSIGSNGKLTLAGRQSTSGVGPRNFAMDPEGNYLLVGNQKSDSIVIFKRNKKTGLLTDTHKRIEVGEPVCIVFSAID